MDEPKIVVIGGGTGLSVILRGLKKITQDITAIVTVSDDGGGSGVLREDLGMLPPGDIRACLIALSDVSPYLEDLFNYRYENGNLKGQSFGNLMIAAMQGITSDFREAVLRVGEIIRINGQVLPVTLENVHLIAELNNGHLIKGESKIPYQVMKEHSRISKVELSPYEPKPTEGVLEAINQADIILLGPGSLYTSVIPNLIVGGISTAIEESEADVIYIANLMTQPGETDGFSLREHLEAIEIHTKTSLIDQMIVNDRVLPNRIRDKYRSEQSQQIRVKKSDIKYMDRKNITLIKGDFMEIVREYCRHDAGKIAEAIQEIYQIRKNNANPQQILSDEIR
jgi:uncharacterized cofD-like protein